jgi:hypothetical protein
MSWGIPVMATRLATTSPMTDPRARPMAMSSRVGSTPRAGRLPKTRPMAASTATPMPTAPATLPATAVSWRDRPAAARMNRIAAAM